MKANIDCNELVETRIKEDLEYYMDLENEIDNQIERYERMKSKLEGIGSPVLSDMPKGSGSPVDRLTNMIQKKDELYEQLMESMAERDALKDKIKHAIAQIRRADERAVIRIRYLDRCQWKEVNEVLFGNRSDFDERMESYLRRCYYLHDNALMHMAALGTW